MAKHKALVEEADLLAYLGTRAVEHTLRFGSPEGGLTDSQQEEIKRRVNEEAASFDDVGAWNAECACGWKGNNPYPGRDAAVGALEEHYRFSRIEEQRERLASKGFPTPGHPESPEAEVD